MCLCTQFCEVTFKPLFIKIKDFGGKEENVF